MVAPAGWKEVRLGEICDFVKTIALSRSQLEADHGVGCIHYGDIHTKFNDRLDCSIIRLPMAESEMVVGVPRLKIGDLVIADASEDMMGVGKGIEILGVPDHGVVAGLHTAVLRPQVGLFSKGFLGQLQHMPEFKEQARVLASGLKVYGLSKTSISKISVTIPPLKEQEAIAEALSDADVAIKSLDALIAKKRDVKQATMQQLLTGRTRLPGFTADWKEVRLGDLGSTFGGLIGKSSKDFGDGNSSFVTFMNVMSNIVLNNQGTEKVRIGNGERQSQLLEGDVIFNGSSETPEEVGFGSAVPIELSGLYLNSFCFGFRRKDTKSLDPKFFAYQTRSPLGRDIIRPMAQGSTRYNIAKTNLLNGQFPLPPLKEQEAIAQALTVIDDELQALTEQVSKLRMVKEGMMQDLLTGKVRLA